MPVEVALFQTRYLMSQYKGVFPFQSETLKGDNDASSKAL